MTKSKRRATTFPSLNPIRIRQNHGAASAWFYENAKSIDVYIQGYGNTILSCRLSLKQLERYVRRACAALRRAERGKR